MKKLIIILVLLLTQVKVITLHHVINNPYWVVMSCNATLCNVDTMGDYAPFQNGESDRIIAIDKNQIVTTYVVTFK